MRKGILSSFGLYAASQRGATAVEYSILAGGIALSVFLVLLLLGADFSAIMDIISGEIATAVDEVDLE